MQRLIPFAIFGCFFCWSRCPFLVFFDLNKACFFYRHNQFKSRFGFSVFFKLLFCVFHPCFLPEFWTCFTNASPRYFLLLSRGIYWFFLFLRSPVFCPLAIWFYIKFLLFSCSLLWRMLLYSGSKSHKKKRRFSPPLWNFFKFFLFVFQVDFSSVLF